jgi:hypothetical protein
VLYHADCADGFGAAWALWKRFPAATFVPVKHGFAPPTGLGGQDIVMVDFSYARPTLESLASEAKSLVVLDHHITAEKALADLPYAYFDLTKSGAVLAWEWAHDESIPWLLRYIQDKDLWQWALPDSREISASLASHPFDFELWSRLDQQVLLTEGRAILRYEATLLTKLEAEARTIPFHGSVVPVVHSPVMTSQLGERLSAQAPFCVMWHERDGRRYYSLRSSNDGGADVAAIASAYGGGGHTHAAGFSIPLPSDGASLPLDPAGMERRRPPA